MENWKKEENPKNRENGEEMDSVTMCVGFGFYALCSRNECVFYFSRYGIFIVATGYGSKFAITVNSKYVFTIQCSKGIKII